jgi:hypothetical protein
VHSSELWNKIAPSALPPKADIRAYEANVRFVPKGDIDPLVQDEKGR